jgi:hypothetical protein
VSVTSYCDTEYIYTNGKSKVKREDLSFKVIGDRYEVKDNEVRFGYSSNPNRQERILSWTLEQNETGEIRKVTLRQEKRNIEIGLFDSDVEDRGSFSANLHYIPNGLGLSYQAYLEESRFGVGLYFGMPLFNNPYVKSSSHFSLESTVTVNDVFSSSTVTETVNHSDVHLSPEIQVKNDLSFYTCLGLTCSFALNTYLDIEYSPIWLMANHRYDLDGTWERITTTTIQNGKQDITVEYQKEDSEIQRIWLYKNDKYGFMNRFGVRAFIPIGGDFVINIGYGYNINTIKGISNYSDFSLGFSIIY